VGEEKPEEYVDVASVIAVPNDSSRTISSDIGAMNCRRVGVGGNEERSFGCADIVTRINELKINWRTLVDTPNNGSFVKAEPNAAAKGAMRLRPNEFATAAILRCKTPQALVTVSYYLESMANSTLLRYSKIVLYVFLVFASNLGRHRPNK
jgi:hypothetical protein